MIKTAIIAPRIIAYAVSGYNCPSGARSGVPMAFRRRFPVVRAVSGPFPASGVGALTARGAGCGRGGGATVGGVRWCPCRMELTVPLGSDQVGPLAGIDEDVAYSKIGRAHV